MTWVVIMVTVGAVLAIVIARATRDAIYPLVFVWAYAAIAVKQADIETILYVAAGWAVVLLVVSIRLFTMKPKPRLHEPA